MGEISDNFNQDLDRSEYGIGACAVVRMEHEGVLGVNDVLCSEWLLCVFSATSHIALQEAVIYIYIYIHSNRIGPTYCSQLLIFLDLRLNKQSGQR